MARCNAKVTAGQSVGSPGGHRCKRSISSETVYNPRYKKAKTQSLTFQQIKIKKKRYQQAIETLLLWPTTYLQEWKPHKEIHQSKRENTNKQEKPGWNYSQCAMKQVFQMFSYDKQYWADHYFVATFAYLIMSVGYVPRRRFIDLKVIPPWKC